MSQWTSPTQNAGQSDNTNATTAFVTGAIATAVASIIATIGQLNPTVVTTNTFTPAATDRFIAVNFPGPVLITLPTVASQNKFPIFIKDISGAANVNNITIQANAADTYGIDGAATAIIATRYGGYYLGPGTWVGVTTGWVDMP